MLTSMLSSSADEHQEYTDESDERRDEGEVRADRDRGSVLGVWALGRRVVFGLHLLHAALVAGIHALDPPHAWILARLAVQQAARVSI